MLHIKKNIKDLFILFTLICCGACSTSPSIDIQQDTIISGIAWYDQNNNPVNAHGAGILKEGNLYYLFGEHKSDMSNAFTGFSCYSSSDLVNWKFENMVLSQQKDGLLGPERVGERPKVLKCPATGEFIMYMHCDNPGYKDQYIGYATSSTINGDYQFQGPLMMDGKAVRKWDMGTFLDSDGKGYLLTHSGYIYALADDFKSVDSIVVQNIVHGESPAMFHYQGTYYWLVSNLTSWEKNDNSYLTAPSLTGPWTKKGFFTPTGTLTWNSQTTFVLPVYNETDTLFMFMGDRWSFPRQGTAGSYVWQPITLKNGEMSIPEFQESWKIDLGKATWEKTEISFNPADKKHIKTDGKWIKEDNLIKSKERGATLTYTFTGKQILFYGISDNTSGYGKVSISDNKEQEIFTTYVDFYSKYSLPGLKFKSPVLEEGKYTLKIEVEGFHPTWTDKTKTIYGSTDDYITITEIGIL